MLECPNCGVREVTDFGFGGEISPRPKSRPSFRELNTYNYFRRNVAGVQREWWFHRSGCRAWFIAERDTTTNEVLFTALPSEAPPPGRAAAMSRLNPQPQERIDRQRKVSFTFDGKPVEAYEGDTIGSALYAAGQRTFSRSFKYHRRRGLMCCAGQCPNCIVRRRRRARARGPAPSRCARGSRSSTSTRSSLEFDAMRATDLVGSQLTPPGFYYKTFIRPRKLWPLYEKVLRNAAGLGKLRHEQAEREWRTEYRRRHADVLVVGGGIAGLNAAIAAAQLGADVVLADEGPALGGQQLIEADRERRRAS